MTFHTNGIKKQAGVVILTAGKIGFKPKLIRRDKEGCFILIKRSVYWENIAMISLYALSIDTLTL